MNNFNDNYDWLTAAEISRLTETLEHLNDTPEEKEKWKREREIRETKRKTRTIKIFSTLIICLVIVYLIIFIYAIS